MPTAISHQPSALRLSPFPRTFPHHYSLTAGKINNGGRFDTTNAAIDDQVHLFGKSFVDDFGVGIIFYLLPREEKRSG